MEILETQINVNDEQFKRNAEQQRALAAELRERLVLVRQGGGAKAQPRYEPIHMPKNSPLGLYIGALSFFLGFGIIWYLWWMAIASVLGIAACCIFRLSDEHTDYHLSANDVAKIEAECRKP